MGGCVDELFSDFKFDINSTRGNQPLDLSNFCIFGYLGRKPLRLNRYTKPLHKNRYTKTVTLFSFHHKNRYTKTFTQKPLRFFRYTFLLALFVNKSFLDLFADFR